MPGPTARPKLLAVGLALLVVLLVGFGWFVPRHSTPAAAVAGGRDAAATARRHQRIVSTSGIPHADVADYRLAPLWRPGMPTGITASWQRALDEVVGQIADERPDAVLHTGDMVEGRWGVDRNRRGVFGPVATFRQRRRALRRAADVYYRQMRDLWMQYGFRPHVAMGDHEYGDMDGTGLVASGQFRSRTMSTRRASWVRAFDTVDRYDLHPPRGRQRTSAYAVRIGDVGLVTLDPITTRPDGLHARISGSQLAWLRDVIPALRARGARWIIVQSEIPAIGPNRARGTSALLLENGPRLWRLLGGLRVDLLLSAEFHTMTTHSNAGRRPVQIVHGGSLAAGHANWLVIDTFDNRLELELRAVEGHVWGPQEIWAPSRRRALASITVGRPESAGSMVLHADGTTSDRTGYLREGCHRHDRCRGRTTDSRLDSRRRPAFSPLPTASARPESATATAAPSSMVGE